MSVHTAGIQDCEINVFKPKYQCLHCENVIIPVCCVPRSVYATHELTGQDLTFRTR